MRNKLNRALCLAAALVLLLALLPAPKATAADGVWEDGKVYPLGQQYSFPALNDDQKFFLQLNPTADQVYHVDYMDQIVEIDSLTIFDDGSMSVGTSGGLCRFPPTSAKGYKVHMFHQYEWETIWGLEEVNSLPASYTVSFNTNGGSAVAAQTVESGKKATKPADPSKTGYTFGGWYTDSALTSAFNFDTAINAATSLYAKWTVNRYTLSFNTDGGSETAPITQDYATAVTPPADPTRTGYTFAGWEPEIPSTIPAEDVTFTAQWTINQYTLSFDPNGGSAVAAITQDYASAVTPPAYPTRTGYTFAGWDQEIPAAIPAEDRSFTAQWTINQYTLTFDSNGGSAVAAITQDYATTVTPPADPTRTGYTFAGWEPEIPSTIPAEDVTFTAQWTINQYTLTFDTDGGTEIAPITQDYATAVTPPADPTKTGYTFTGWDKEIPAAIPAEDMTITAQWTINQYTLTFDSDGGSAIDPITQDYATAVTAPANPTKLGHTFESWEPAVPETIPAEDMTLTAQWKINQYGFAFETDGGSVVPPIIQNFGTAVMTPEDPTREGYTFDGWDKEIPTVMPAEDITFTAQWLPVIESELKVSGGQTPDVTVNGLDELAEATSAGEPVSLTMRVRARPAGAIANSSEITALARVEHPFQTLEFMDIKVEKASLSTTETMSETGTVLEIVVPFDFKGKEYVTFYRYHDGVAETLVESDSGEDGTYRMDEQNGLLTVYTSKFSTYAIGYTQCYNIDGTVAYGSYTGDVTVSLFEKDAEEPSHTATVSMTDGVGAYSFTHVLEGVYTLRTEWVEGEKEITLEETLSVR